MTDKSDKPIREFPAAPPELFLLQCEDTTFADLMEMFRKLTGREPTAEEIEEARREWEEIP
jgi:hypothetical protein